MREFQQDTARHKQDTAQLTEVHKCLTCRTFLFVFGRIQLPVHIFFFNSQKLHLQLFGRSKTTA